MNTKRLRPLLEKEFGAFTFAIVCRASRESLRLSQVEFAKKLGIAKGTLCDIEKGRQTVSPRLAIRIANKAGLSEAIAVKACLQDLLNKSKIKMQVEIVA